MVHITERERMNAGVRALFLSNAADERIESLGPLHRIALQSHLIGGCSISASMPSTIPARVTAHGAVCDSIPP
jgi:hypothetical protein